MKSVTIFLLLTLCFQFVPLNADAATQRTSSRSTYYRDGLSSSQRRAVEKLGKEAEEEIIIPVLLGVKLSAISPNFGDPRGGGTRLHQGLDIMAPKHTPIVSPTDAYVLRISDGESSGITVTTLNPGGERFTYMHLHKVAEGISEGDSIKKGEVIGMVGNTGNASGGADHLHFEIRSNNENIDPYPRIRKEISLADKMNYLDDYLDSLSSEDAKEYSQQLLSFFRAEFSLASMQGVALPNDIASVFTPTSAVTTTTTSSALTRDLSVGMSGADVIFLQSFLIAQNKGSAAVILSSYGATGYFGEMTRLALAEWQASQGISPAVGYCGPQTRARISTI